MQIDTQILMHIHSDTQNIKTSAPSKQFISVFLICTRYASRLLGTSSPIAFCFVIRIFNKETIAYIGRKAYSSTAVSTEYSFSFGMQLTLHVNYDILGQRIKYDLHYP